MNTQRRVSVIAGALGILLLVGCAASPKVVGPVADPSPSEASPTPTPTPTALSELTFEAGADLDPAEWTVEWGDPFLSDPGFSVLSPDDGNGSWSYTHDETGCRLFFYQGAVTDLDMSQDDRTISDEYLTIMLSARMDSVTQADVTANAFDDSMWQSDLSSTVATRTIWGTATDDSTWLDSARMFGTLGGGIHIAITCPAGQDMVAEHNMLFDEYLTVFVSPT